MRFPKRAFGVERRPGNDTEVIADTGAIDITVTAPAEFAGTWSFTVADLAAGPVNLVPPAISGTAAAGQVLSAADGLWASDTSAPSALRRKIVL